MPKITKLLIANRGEIACRIIRTARKMGIKTVAVYSEADFKALHVNEADEAVFIGASPATASYINVKRIVEAVKMSGADAVHPGYGFLSENATFAEQLAKNNIIFVGPSPIAIKKTGDKIQAKKIALQAGVNTVPGYSRSIKNVAEALRLANKIGYPVILKAAAGGGGKGMRIIHGDSEMAQSLSSAQYEAQSNFADGRTFIEKYIVNPRHIEIQILGDMYGNYVCLGERECSIQRHHQKVIEEAPSIFINDKIRQKMYRQSIALAKATNYFSVGTVEFIVDEKRNFYFMEMNSRIQVEHPVTELVTGIDIVEQMLLVAQGEPLKLKQKDITIAGHATECRVYAEDPASGFLPSTGRITTYIEPKPAPGVRIDTGVYEGGEVSMFYDAMISKVCTHGPTRADSIEMMKQVLSEYVIQGISHNISGFLQKILHHPDYMSGKISTHFVENVFKTVPMGAVLDSEASAVILSSAAYIFLTEQRRNWSVSGRSDNRQMVSTRWVVVMDDMKYPITIRPIDEGYKISFEHRRLYITSCWHIGSRLFQCSINGQNYSLQVERNDRGYYRITFMDQTALTSILSPRAAELSKYVARDSAHQSQLLDVTATMSGVITDIKVQEGAAVMKGQVVALLEAMKMENIVVAPSAGKVAKVNVAKGDHVTAGAILVELE